MTTSTGQGHEVAGSSYFQDDRLRRLWFCMPLEVVETKASCAFRNFIKINTLWGGSIFNFLITFSNTGGVHIMCVSCVCLLRVRGHR